MARLVLTSLVLSFLPPLSASAGNTLFADISANPSTGVGSLTGVDLSATVSGTATGSITYRFDCASDGNWEQTQVLNQTSYTAVDLCNYASVGNHTATVKVERENLSFQGTIAILVQAQPVPTVDIKANNSDGPVTITYNTAATLSWTSTNATSCAASGDWTGAKAISGSESTGNLTSSKTYTITCSGAGGTAADSVSVIVNAQPALYVTLEASPNVGVVPLNGVNLRATVAGTAAGIIDYKFDCTSDGVWDYAISTNDIQFQTGPLCNYPNVGSYQARVQAQRDNLTVQGNSVVQVGTQSSGSTPTLFVNLQAQPNNGNAPLGSTLTAVASGTVTGNTIFKFDCTSDGVWENTVTSGSGSASFSCTYSPAGTYVAKIQADRGGLTVWGTSTIVAR